MFFGTGTTSSVSHAAGSAGGGVSARPNALVVLVKTNAPTFASAAASRRFSVPVRFTSMKSWRRCVATCGLCNVAACSTASTPRIARRTKSASTIEPWRSVNGESSTSVPRGSCFDSRSVRISASPRWPALPVTRIFMTVSVLGGGRLARRDRLLDANEMLEHLGVDAVGLLVQVRDFELGLDVDLVLDIRAHAVLLGLPILADQHEARKKDRLERRDHRQQPERIRIEHGHADRNHVDEDPRREPDRCEREEPHAAAEPGDPVDCALQQRRLFFDFLVDVARDARL